ncbi:helix-turn-helix domain-containing protein [Desulfonatronum thioautotrophicum]|uniref:helix-turn-helix domain-containing protein n=1 Tax=Desulfonatronum thioautotrophicum TaxID=617001 RepID=UPI0005EBA572|nr:helix-turn-helix transcriptional regulator [Desulfonatronum thioautotrophicum]
MSTQNMTQAQISLPADSLELVTALVIKLGGHVVQQYSSAQGPMPELDRGGKMLKGLRLRAGFTQAEIANALGIPQSHISEFERDKRSIPFKHARKLAELLHTVPSHFMQPNEETREAMAELEAGNGQRCASADQLFLNLGI